MPFLLRMRKQRNQTGFAAKRLRGLSTKKKPRRIEPRRSTIQLSTWSDGHQQKAQQQISSNLSNALPISELWLYWHGSIRAGPSIQGIGFPQYWFCTGHITSPVRLQFPLCQLQHTKQLHSIHVSRAWLLDSHQNNYLICQLVQTQGQKKSLDKIKASSKQTVHVPTDFNSMGTQFQEVFFGDESVCSTSLRQLLITIGRNKKTFRDHIALDDLFVAKFMLAVDRRIQRWFGMCERATVSRSQVDHRVLQFDSLMEDILNGQFIMTLPATFKKVQATNAKLITKTLPASVAAKVIPATKVDLN